MPTDPERAARIAARNDKLRKDFVNGQLMISAGVQALPHSVKTLLMRIFQEFDTFNPNNDPHGEHDFIQFTVNGHQLFAKADYYAPDMAHGQDPLDPTTVIVWTIGLQEEY